MSANKFWSRYANNRFMDFLCVKVYGLAWKTVCSYFQWEFGGMKNAGWTGPRRVCLQNNYLIFFSIFFRFFAIFSKKRESDRVTARVIGSQRWTGPCRTGSYEEQRRGRDHRRLHDILHQRGHLLTSEPSWKPWCSTRPSADTVTN